MSRKVIKEYVKLLILSEWGSGAEGGGIAAVDTQVMHIDHSIGPDRMNKEKPSSYDKNKDDKNLPKMDRVKNKIQRDAHALGTSDVRFDLDAAYNTAISVVRDALSEYGIHFEDISDIELEDLVKQFELGLSSSGNSILDLSKVDNAGRFVFYSPMSRA